MTGGLTANRLPVTDSYGLFVALDIEPFFWARSTLPNLFENFSPKDREVEQEDRLALCRQTITPSLLKVVVVAQVRPN